MLESLNYIFRNPKKHNLSNLPHQTVEKLQKKNHGVLRGPQLGKQRWRARLGILRVKAQRGEMYTFTHPLISVLDACEWLTSIPCRFTPPPQEGIGNHCVVCWLSTRENLDRCGKSRPNRDFYPRTSHQVATRYTNYAILWPNSMYILKCVWNKRKTISFFFQYRFLRFIDIKEVFANTSEELPLL